MKFTLPIAMVLGVASEAAAYRCPQSPSPAKTATYEGFLGRVHRLNGQELPYRLFVPENYDPNTAYPLVLYLHHAGLAGTDGNNDSGWDNCVQLTSEIGSGDDYGGVFTNQAVDEDGNRFDTQERYPHFVLAPHANSPQYGFGGGVAGSATGAEHPTRPLLWGILEQVQNEFKIDRSRLYVTGISMGCYGTWDIIMRSPGVFAAASPQSCRGDPNTMLLAKLKDMPIWSMCGTNDSYFSGAQAMANAMQQVGATASTFTFTAMQGVGHSINDRGYDYPGFIDWMFAQRLPGVDPGGGGAGGSGGSSGGAGAPTTGGSAGNGGAPAQGGAGTAGTGGNDSGGGDSAAGAGASAVGGSASTGGGSGRGMPPSGGAGAQGTAAAASTGEASEPGCSIAQSAKAPGALTGLFALAVGAVACRRRRHGTFRKYQTSRTH